MKAQPKISVVIPVYNVEKYLRNCLDSVINQSEKDIEIICVEDCSTDSSVEILKEYAEKDSRITCIFHKKNAGVSLVRRDGIAVSKGEYILFLDSDDYLAGNACRALYKEIKKQNVDILQFGSTVVPADGVDDVSVKGVEQILVPYCEHIVADYAGEITNAAYRDKKFGFTLWNKLMRGDVVRHALKYCMNQGINLGDDAYIFFMISFFAKSFSGIPQKYHFYNFGAGMTGGIKSVTDKQFYAKNRRGLIIDSLREFCAELDPAKKVEEALDSLCETFIQDSVSNMIWLGDVADKTTVLRDLLSYYEKDKVIAEFANTFQHIPWDRQRQLLNSIDPKKLFTRKSGDVKTVATYYHRINNGGIERVLAKLMEMWVSKGYKVILFTEDVPNPQDYSYPKEVVRLIIPKADVNSKQATEERTNYLQTMLDRYSVDLMVYHAWVAPSILPDMLAVKSLGIPFIVNNHSYFYFDIKSMWAMFAHSNLLLTVYNRFFDGIVVLSEVDYQWLKIRYNQVYKSVNPLMFDLNKVKPVNVTKNRDLLWVGRLSVEKNLPSALQILKSIIDKGYEVRLHVVGESHEKEYHQYIQNEINNLNLKDYVVMHGYHSDVSPFYEKAAVFLLTSEFEGFSMVIAESKAYGIPTVMYDLPNLDFVRVGRGMKVVPQHNTEMAADEIIKLLQDDKARAELGREARESIEDMYSTDVAEIWKNIFEDVVKNNPIEPDTPASLQIAFDMLHDGMERGIESRLHDLQYWINQANSRPVAPVPYEDPRIKVLELYKNREVGFKFVLKYFFAWLKAKFTRKKK